MREIAERVRVGVASVATGERDVVADLAGSLQPGRQVSLTDILSNLDAGSIRDARMLVDSLRTNLSRSDGGPLKRQLQHIARKALQCIPERPAAVRGTQTLAGLDRDFAACASDGDRARDSARWGDGETAYRNALALYPHHAGYVVQLGHCLKEQGKFAEAEIQYRSAAALGDMSGDLDGHIAYAASRWRDCGNDRAILDHVRAYWANPAAGALGRFAHPPSQSDVNAAHSVLIGCRPEIDRCAELMRSCATAASLYEAIIRSGPFAAANRGLLAFLHDTKWDGTAP